MDDHSSSTPNSTFDIFSGNVTNWDFMDEILYQGWIEKDGGFNFLQQALSTSNVLHDPSLYIPVTGTPNLSIASNEQDYQEETERHCHGNPPLDYPNSTELVQTELQVEDSVETSTPFSHPRSCGVEAAASGFEWQMVQRVNPGTSCSVKERVMQAVGCLKNRIQDRDILIQIWLPMEIEGKRVLATIDQPYFVNPSCKSLASYRKVSTAYHFQAEEDARSPVGFPGRVFLEKLPEWTPDVSLFKSEEYPHKDHAVQHHIKGSLALPLFKQGSKTCLGIVEIATTIQKISYRQELEDICKVLQAVDLRSSEDFCSPGAETCNRLNQAAVPEIPDIVKSVCKTYRLPLALTWALCSRQGKSGRQQFPERFSSCISTVDSACFLADRGFSGFHMASFEQYLFLGQGIVGRAFTTQRQCFTNDMTSFSKKDYPLAHHAKIFGLHAAIAIPLRSISTGFVEFVLELFLPKDCQDTEEKKEMWDLLPVSIKQVCRSLQVVMDKELDIEKIKSFVSSPSKEAPPDESSWIARMVEAQKKGKSCCITWDYPKEPKEELKMITHGDDSKEELDNKQEISELGQLQQNPRPNSSIEGDGVSSAFGGRYLLGSTKTSKKRRTKREIQTISLGVLQQYFAGSLNDAAQSLGVCSTTLKRICRQHGIKRWPSRKIKMVDHSLRKLQQMIDTVHGAKGAVQNESFYPAFPGLSSPKLSSHTSYSSFRSIDNSKHLDSPPDDSCPSGIASKSHSSPCSRSSCSSNCCSGRAQQHAATAITGSSNGNGSSSLAETSNGISKRTCSSELAELHCLNNQGGPDFLVRSQIHKTRTVSDHIHLSELESPPRFGQSLREGGVFEVKAIYGVEKDRLGLQPKWGVRDLQQEIGKRFEIDDFTWIGLKYMDDDGDWVRLTCDSDLEECKEIHRISQRNTIKISLHKYPSPFGFRDPPPPPPPCPPPPPPLIDCSVLAAKIGLHRPPNQPPSHSHLHLRTNRAACKGEEEGESKGKSSRSASLAA
uniref:Protein NLP2-like isoform X1 n=1 Tax=Populus alba TaxID=43335 RepID=A0A4U5PZX9_POPAL|nr:protein NLP2-like isoform X1 [Populus alba]